MPLAQELALMLGSEPSVTWVKGQSTTVQDT